MCENIITMTGRELERYHVLQRLLKKEVMQAKARELLG